jgi:hypothetical protein
MAKEGNREEKADSKKRKLAKLKEVQARKAA